MVVAEIAYNHLSPAVKAKCDALIAVPLTFASTASTNFVTAASWADDFKSQLGTGTSHYIDLPLCISGYLGNNCADGTSTNNAPPGVPNVVTALNQNIATLQNPSATLTDQATALRYVLHFVGDIQQPLHASNGISTSHPPPSGDGGGNGFSLHGTWSELHALWDAGGGYLNDSGVSRPMQASGYAIISNKVADVEATYPYSPNIGTIPDPMTWATDSFYYAQTVAYAGITEGGTPTTSYLSTASATSKQRMAAGGHRLADLLMTIFATNAASFTASQTNGAAPLFVTFTDTSTGGITNRFWNFGDGSTTNFTAPTNPTHTYTAGTYNVTLIVSGSINSSTNTKPAYITASPPPPVASFAGSPTNGVVPLTVTFTDTSSGSITNWSWNFGDGGTTNVTTNSVLYTYNTPGIYGVSETVSGPGGSDTDTQANYIAALTAFQSWQIQYFGCTNCPQSAATADPDGDGCNNLCEFLSGTDPTNSASGFRITSVATAGSDVAVTWATGLGRTNVVQASTGLADGSYGTNFADVSPMIILPAGSGDTSTNYTDPGGATNAPYQYYRVRLQP